MTLFEFTRSFLALEEEEEGGFTWRFQHNICTDEQKSTTCTISLMTYTCLCTIFDPVRLRLRIHDTKKLTTKGLDCEDSGRR